MDKTELAIEKYINDCATKTVEMGSIENNKKQLARNIRDIDNASEEYASTVKQIKMAFKESDWPLLDKKISELKKIYYVDINADITDSMDYHNSILLDDMADKMADKIVDTGLLK